jgi:hypothetical protein
VVSDICLMDVGFVERVGKNPSPILWDDAVLPFQIQSYVSSCGPIYRDCDLPPYIIHGWRTVLRLSQKS